MELIAYIKSAKSYFDEDMGTTESNNGAHLLLESASIAWGWSYLLFNTARSEHVQALVRVQHAFSDFLSHTDQPARDAYPYVAWPWPSDTRVSAQHMILTKRLRIQEQRHHCFTRVTQVGLQSLRLPNIAYTVLARNAQQLHLTDAIMWRVFEFEFGGEDPSMCGDVFLVDPKSLSLVGWSLRVAPKMKHRKRFLAASRPELVPPNIVAVTKEPLRGKVVKVHKLHRAADAALVHAALDVDKSLSE